MMNTGNIEYSKLEELSHSDYQLTAGEADIRRWQVKSENGVVLGRVRDLLFDPEQRAIRYLIVDLDHVNQQLEEKAILIPIGLANLGTGQDEVIVPDLHHDQLSAMPRYIIGEVTTEMEENIRSVIGSPAALRMEETIVEIDRANFYRHQHFADHDLLRRKI